MGKTKYQKAVELLTRLKKQKGPKIGAMRLRHFVMIEIGGDMNRTVIRYLKFMRDVGLIEDIDNQHFLIKV